jgi:ribonuclease VapC
MFLDASVLIAVLAGEPEALALKSAMLEAEPLATSQVAIFETSCRLAKLRGLSIADAYLEVMDFLQILDVEQMAVDDKVGAAAHACAARYHHLTGHPARLNMGDCFAYAAARTSGLKLAYKGNDFVHTDIDGVRFGPDAEPPRP